MLSNEARTDLTWLERVGVALLILAAFVPRVRDLGATFDRSVEGFQGSCIATYAVNYERLGIGAFGGYPVFNIDLPTDPERTPYVYANHPPPMYLVAWLGIRLFGPDGWDTAWERGAPPANIEGAMRIPFFLGHVLFLFGLWWAVRQGGGARLSFLTLAFAGVLPVAIVFSTLVNYENLWLAPVVFAFGFHARFLQSGRIVDLACVALLFGLASTITFMPVMFLPGLVLQTLFRRGWGQALFQGAVIGAAALAPLIAHGLWVGQVLGDTEAQGVWTRAKDMLAPLFDGSLPLTEWVRRQGVRFNWFFSEPLSWVAMAGLGIALADGLRGRRREVDPAGVSLALPFTAGGVLVFLLFYKHTWDGDRADNGQTLFLMNLIPAAAVLAATFFDRIAPALYRLRGGVAPLVLLVGMVAFPALMRAGTIRHAWRGAGPHDDPSVAAGPPTPLPITAGMEIATLLPGGSIGFYPRGIGFTTAVSYYAWRTLLPVDEATWGGQLIFLDHPLGIADLPRYFVIPKDPPPQAADHVHYVRTKLAAEFDMLSETQHYELWPSFE